MEDAIVIKVPSKQTRKNNIPKEKKIDPRTLEGFVELKNEYLRHLHGSWLKFVSKKTKKVEVGGFLDKIDNENVYLRCPSRENISVNMENAVFFVKSKDLNYISLTELLKEKDRELYDLYSYKKKITKMINDGEIKFIK